MGDTMTQEEIIEMARQANAGMLHGGGYSLFGNDAIEAFAKLVAAKEREACAKVCETLSDEFHAHAMDCAKAIRARGEQ